jgi:hypothetical protein
MIAKGFKPVGWVAAVGGAALSCYMLSLQVASERAELASIERRIIAAKQDIRSLQTELGTRGRMTQLERWNAEVLALSAPAAGQFLENEMRLASFETRDPGLDATATVRMASAAQGSAPASPAAPAAAPASPVPTVRQAAAPAPAAELKPVVRQASATREVEAPLVRRAAATTIEAEAPAPTVRRAAAPSRPAALLDEGTLRAINSEARTERQGGKRD